MIRWTLTGTESQKAIAREAFNRIKFPFEALTGLPGSPELGWADLNGGRYAGDAARHHEGHHPGEERPDTLEGIDEQGRRFVYGVIYTMSGRIYIDVSLESQPDVAMAVIGAEIAHAVDFFLPMTDTQRNELLALWNRPDTTWWEVADYGEEYYRLGGEAFMHEFVAAYSDMQFGNKSDFVHDVGVEPADVWRILGIKRTDYVEPTSTKVSYGSSKIYHKLTHKVRSKYPPMTVVSTTGMAPCKVCKP